MALGFKEYYDPKTSQIFGVRQGTGEVSYAKPIKNRTPNLPLYERQQVKNTAPSGAQPLYAYQPSTLSASAQSSRQSSGSVLGSSTKSSSNNDNNSGDDTSLIDLINEEYKQYNSLLGGLENSAKQQTEVSRNNLQTSAETALENTGLEEQGERAALKQRQADYNQRNIARLSNLGAFGSSAADAVAERTSRIALQEAGKISNYFNQARNGIRTTLQEGLAQLENELNSRLSRIDELRATGASEKARAKRSAWENYVNQVSDFRNSMANYDLALRQWVADKTGNIDSLLAGIRSYEAGDFGAISPDTPFNGLGQLPSTIGSGIPVSIPMGAGTAEEEEQDDLLSILSTAPSTISQGV